MTALLFAAAMCLAQAPERVDTAAPVEAAPAPAIEVIEEAAPTPQPERAPPPAEPAPVAPEAVPVPSPVPVPVPAPVPLPTPVPVPVPEPVPVPDAPPTEPAPPAEQPPLPEPAGPQQPGMPRVPLARDTAAPAGLPFMRPPFLGPREGADEQQIVIVPQVPQAQPIDNIRDVLLPALPMRGLRNGIVLLLLAFASGLVAAMARRARVPLQHRGLLPSTLRVTETAARILVVFFGLGVLAAWLPASLAPGLPWVVVAGAVAIGWSARDVLPDLVAWLFMSMEGHVRAGQWLEVDGRRGRVEQVGIRATWLRDTLGNELVVPNRLLAQAPVVGDEGWPTVEVRLRVDADYGPAQIRSALREAAHLSPWVAPCVPEVYRDGDEWVVRLDLLEGGFAERLEGALIERLEEILGP